MYLNNPDLDVFVWNLKVGENYSKNMGYYSSCRLDTPDKIDTLFFSNLLQSI